MEWNSDTKFDIIIGNPPYNTNGTKKVPTNNTSAKKSDGQTIWCNIVKKNIQRYEYHNRFLFNLIRLFDKKIIQ